MNKTFRLIWNAATGCWNVASELVRSKGKTKARTIGTIAAGLLTSGAALAELPTGGNIIAGSGSINQNGNTLTVTQDTHRMAANWSSFSIGQGNTVEFIQPSTSAVALNRVTGIEASILQGNMRSNGHVILVNPNGIHITNTAQINVGGLVASTLDITTDDFMAGNYSFSGMSPGQIINQGTIQTPDGGTVAFIAAKIINTGTIHTPRGNTLMGAGSQVTLDLGGPLKLRVDQAAVDALIETGGAIRADGGYILIEAQAAGDLKSTVINHTGILEAKTLGTDEQGRIALKGDSAIEISGTLTTQAPQGTGGTITIEAEHIHLADTASIDATGATGGGDVLIGGDWQGGANEERRVFDDPNALEQATTVTMEQGATIDASATDNGDGGTVVLWSDVTNSNSITTASGTIYAKGGANGGDGGQIETSGGLLNVDHIQVLANAAHGLNGEWLLDPHNITISGGTTSNISTSDTTYTSTNNSSVLNVNTITSALNAGTNVTVQTGSGGSQIGDITVDTSIQKTGGNAATLTLRAHNNVVINSSVASTSNALNINLIADSDKNGGGIVIVRNNLYSNGGAITFGDGSTIDIGGVQTQVGGDVYVDLYQAGSFLINWNTAGGALVSGATLSPGGALTVNGEMLIGNTGGLAVTTNGGAVALNGSVNSANQYTLVNVSAGITWEAALAAAKSGQGDQEGDSYLATITTRLENAIASQSAEYRETWLGGRRVTGIGTDRDWRWVAGPEGLTDGGNGLVFARQKDGGGADPVSGYFNNWNNGGFSPEPNNWDGQRPDNDFSTENESVMQFTGPQGRWNDLPKTGKNLNYYLKETNAAPRALTINAGSGAVTISGGVGTGKELSSFNVTASSTTVNGNGIITTGAQTYSSGVNVSNAGRIEVSGTNVIFNGSFNVTATGTSGSTHDVFLNAAFTNTASSAANFNVQTPRHIQLGSNFSLTSNNAALNTTFWADTDRSSDGIIYVEGASITTQGGTLTFGKSGETATAGGSTFLVGGDVFFQRNSAQTLNTSVSGGTGGAINIYGESIVANTAGLTITSGNGNVTLHGLLNSGSSYTGVYSAAGLTWEQARTAAASVSGGYLATITSRLENSIAGLAVNYNQAWLGGQRNPDNNEWRWVTDPDYNATTNPLIFFYQGQATPITSTSIGRGGSTAPGYFANWNRWTEGQITDNPEPNNSGGNERALQFVGAEGLWNDLPHNSTQLNWYVRETNLAASPVTINAGTGAVAITGGVGTAKALSTFNVTAASTTLNGNGLVTTGAQTYSNALSVTSSSDIRLKATTLSITGADQNLLLKAANDIRVDISISTSPGTSITTQGGDVVLWANTAGASTGGGIFFELDAGIATNGGHLWMGGSTAANGSTTWNGLTVGNGYAVSGTTVLTPVSGTADWLAGVSFKRNAFNTAGGDISIYGRSNESNGIGVSTHREVTFNSGAGQISIEGINTRSDARNGFLWGMHSGNILAESSKVNITSSYSGAGHAITLDASHGNSSRAAAGLNQLRLNATGSAGVYVKGVNTAGGIGIQLGAAEILAASGDIVIETGTSTLDGGRGEFDVDLGTATVGFKTSTAVATSSSDITVISNNVTNLSDISFNTTGALTIRPVTNSSFVASLDTSSIKYSAGITGLTVGGEGNTANITVGSAINIAGPISVYGGDININANIQTTAANANILFKATGNILQTTANTTVTTNGGSAIYWADSDGNNNGRIHLLNNASVVTNGGGIWMGGGAGSTTWVPYANATALTVGSGSAVNATNTANVYGIDIDRSTLDAGAGNIWLSGANSNTGVNYGLGVMLYAGNSEAYTTTVSGGNISITGTGSGSSASAIGHWGVGIRSEGAGNTTVTASGTLNITGTAGGTNSNGGDNHGVFIDKATLTSTGAMTITGSGGGRSGGAANNNGVHITGGAALASGAGALTIVGTEGQNGSNQGIAIFSDSVLGNSLTDASQQTGNITLRANSLTGSAHLLTTGGLVIESVGASFTSAISTTNLTLGSAATGLRIGKSGNTANITLGEHSINGVIELHGGDIAINGALSATDGATSPTLSDINIFASGAVTQSAAITADRLRLFGAGTFTLNNTSNSVNVLTGGMTVARLGSLSFTNAGALSVGDTNTTAIAATGNVHIATVEGNLTLAHSIDTLSANTNAVVLNASQAKAVADGDFLSGAGGNIILGGGNPGITMGSGGRATLYTGSITNSTGLVAQGVTYGLVAQGSGRFRYGSDETTTNFSITNAPLGSGIYVIYREQPTLSGAVSTHSITYGDAMPTFTFSGDSSIQNGDDAAGFTIIGAEYSTAGQLKARDTAYSISPSGFADLGYDVGGSVTEGSISVNRLLLTGSIAASTTTYGSSLVTGAVTFTNKISGDDLGTATVVIDTTNRTSTSNNLRAGSYTGIQSISALDGDDANNYDFSAVLGDYTVEKLALVGSIATSNNVYGDALVVGAVSLTNKVGADDLVPTVNIDTAGNLSTSNHLNAGSYTGIQSISLTGGDADNYTFSNVLGDYTVNQRTLTVTFTGVDKTYDGFNTATVTTADNRVTDDVFNIDRTAIFTAGKNVGTAKAIAVSDVSLTGTDAANYSVTTSGSASANITQLASATWVGTANGNWTDAANWAVTQSPLETGVVPDGANVALAIIPEAFNATITSNTDHGHEGKIEVRGGTLTVGADSHLGAVPANAVADLITLNGGTLAVSTGFEMNANRGLVLGSLGGTVSVASGQTLTLGNTLSGSGALVKGGAGALILANTSNSYVGGTDVAAGELIVRQSEQVLGSGSITLQNGSTLSATESNGQAVTLNKAIALPSGTAHLNVAFSNRTDLILNGVISGDGGLAIVGEVSSRWVQFGGDNSFGGGVTLGTSSTAPRLRINSNTGLGIGTLVVNYSAPDANFSQISFDGNYSLGNAIIVADNAQLNVDSGSSSSLLTDVIAGTGVSFRKLGNGTLTFTENNTFTGTTTVAAGTLVLANDAPNPHSKTFAGSGALRIESVSESFDGPLSTADWSFGTTLTSLTIGSVTNAADISLVSDLTVNGALRLYGGQVNFGNTTVNSLTVTTRGVGGAGGVLQTGSLVVSGQANFVADTGTLQNAVLTNTANDFQGLVSFTNANNGSWNHVSVTDANALTMGTVITTGNLALQSNGALDLGSSTVGGNLEANSTNGNITQTGPLTVTGTSGLTAGTGNITLNDANNNFNSTVNAQGNNITLVDGLGGLTLGNISAAGTLDVTSTDGAIDQALSTTIAVTGETTLVAEQEDSNGNQVSADITLDGSSNNFQDKVNADGANITLVDANELILGDVTATGNLIATAEDDLILDGAVSADTLDLTATNGSIAQNSGDLIVASGPSNITAGTDITLDAATNDFNGIVNAQGSNITLVDGAGGLTLGNITADGTLDVTSTDGAIDQASGTTISVTDETTLVAQQGDGAGNQVSADITLDGSSNNFQDKVNADGANITLVDSNALTLGDVTATGNLDATATELALNGTISVASLDLEATTGDISQGADGTLTVTGGPTDLKAANDITLDKANDFNGVVNADGGNITLNDINGLELGDITASGELDATAENDLSITGDITVQSLTLAATDGSIVQSEDSDITVDDGNVTMNAANALTLNPENDLGTAGLTIGNEGSIADLTITNAITVNSNISLFGGNITLNDSITALNGNDIVISGTNLINTQGANALNVSGTGRWVVYLESARGNDYGDLDSGNTAVWNASPGTLALADVPEGNRYVFNQDPIRTVVITTTDAAKFYGDDIDVSNNYVITSPGITAVAGAYLGVEEPVTLTLADVFTTNPTFSSAKTAAASDAGTAAITSTAGIENAQIYDVSYVDSGVLTVNRRPIELSADAVTITYGDVNPDLSVSIVDGSVATAIGDTLIDVIGTLTRTGDNNAGVYDILLGSGAKADNYLITFNTANQAFEIERARLSATATRVYDGTQVLLGDLLTISGVNGEAFTALGAGTLSTKNVQEDQNLGSVAGLSLTGVAGADLNNYFPLDVADTAITITPLAVTLTAPVVVKTYDGNNLHETTLADLDALSAQLVGGDRISSAEILFDTADVSRDGQGNVLSNKTLSINAFTLDDGNDGNNYNVGVLDANTGRIDPAPLRITAVNDAKFVTQADLVGFMGVIYNGFVGGENAGTAGLFSQTGSVTRSNPSDDAAGFYSGVLLAGGWAANNYVITHEAGDFTIVPADQLLIRAPALSASYGEALPEFTGVSAQYLDSTDDEIKTLTVIYNESTGLYTTNDGVGSTATFGFGIDDAPLSSAGWTRAGGYNVSPNAQTTFSGDNFLDLVMVGHLTVTPKVLNSDLGIAEISKVYDGSRAITGLDLNIDRVLAGVLSVDDVTVAGSGTFDTRHVGTGKNVSISLALRGEDAANYMLSSGSFTDTVGTITQLASVQWVGGDGAVWSDAGNWAGGAIPDQDNVATIIIPNAVRTVYDSAQFGVTSANITNNGVIEFTSADAFAFNNAVSGNGVMAQRGTGMLSVGGNNSAFMGNLDIANYAVTLSHANALGQGSLVSDGGRLALADGITLQSLTVDGDITTTTAIRTLGNQTYNGGLTFLFSGTPASNGTAAVANFSTTNGNIVFNTVSAGAGSKDAERSLVVAANNGTVTFNDQVGIDLVAQRDPFITMRWSDYAGVTHTNPWAVVVDAQQINLFADITTFETQTYNGPVVVGNNGSNGNIRLLVSLDPAITFNSTIDDIDGTHTLIAKAISVDGNDVPVVTVEGAVGSQRALESLVFEAGRQDPTANANVADIDTRVPTRQSDAFIGEVRINSNVTVLRDLDIVGRSLAFGSADSPVTFDFGGTLSILGGLPPEGGTPSADQIAGFAGLNLVPRGAGARISDDTVATAGFQEAGVLNRTRPIIPISAEQRRFLSVASTSVRNVERLTEMGIEPMKEATEPVIAEVTVGSVDAAGSPQGNLPICSDEQLSSLSDDGRAGVCQAPSGVDSSN